MALSSAIFKLNYNLARCFYSIGIKLVYLQVRENSPPSCSFLEFWCLELHWHPTAALTSACVLRLEDLLKRLADLEEKITKVMPKAMWKRGDMRFLDGKHLHICDHLFFVGRLRYLQAQASMFSSKIERKGRCGSYFRKLKESTVPWKQRWG